MEETKKVREEDVLFTNKMVFGDTEEHYYDVDCYDGYGIGTTDEEGIPSEIRVEYPTLDEVLADDEKAEYVLEYRGLWDLEPSDITFGDIMMAYGRVVKS